MLAKKAFSWGYHWTAIAAVQLFLHLPADAPTEAGGKGDHRGRGGFCPDERRKN